VLWVENSVAMGVKGEKSEGGNDIETLRNEWKKMFQEILPIAATSAQVCLELPDYIDRQFKALF
jgi:hypothetical protein